MKKLEPHSFPDLSRCDAISPGAMDSHVRLYQGYVEKFNQLATRRESVLERSAATGELESLKADMTFALGAIKNHELFFESLGEEGHEPRGDLAHAIVQSFHSVPQYLADLKQTAHLGRGWAWTAWDLDQQMLFNYDADSRNGMPVWNTVPLLAIDLYGHAYFYDFGNNRMAYVEAVMKALDWEKIAARLAGVKRVAVV